MKIQGDINSIIYKNEQNGYLIATFLIEKIIDETLKINHSMMGTEITIVGYIPFTDKGEKLKIYGKMVQHPDYGEQFKVETFEKIMPETNEALELYLSNGLLPGIGPATARKIVKKFGDDTIDTIKNEPDELAKIKGISIEKAREISIIFTQNWELWNIVEFLQKFGISPKVAHTIYKKIGAETIEIIKQNPYALGELGVRINFEDLDQIAIKMGFAYDSEERIIAGIIYSLKLALQNGNSCVLLDNLIQFVEDFLKVDEQIVISLIKELRANKKVHIQKISEMDYIYLYNYYKMEKNIADKLKMFLFSENYYSVEKIDKWISKTKLELSEEQKEVLRMVNDKNVSIIAGGPGTGKTTIIKEIINIFETIGKKIVLTAPTGRAAKRMSEASDREAKTLHRLLEIGKIFEDEIERYDYFSQPIDADIVIIDEMSMVDIVLMNYLMNSITLGTKIIFVGDFNQLPSVGPGNILKDLIESNLIPKVVLKKIFRQAAKSKIIVSSNEVNEGINFLENRVVNEISDLEFKSITNTEEGIALIMNYYDDTVQIISPTKIGELGTKNLNKLIQERFNPKNSYKNEKKYGDLIFRENDKVMQIKNNYEINWDRDGEKGQGIFNGEMGYIERISSTGEIITVRFEDNKLADYKLDEIDQIEHCFAITVHKSQGSEFDTVIMPIINLQPMLMTRNILYTGMTRAKKKLYIFGKEKIIEHMIKNTNIKKRNTGLVEKLN